MKNLVLDRAVRPAHCVALVVLLTATAGCGESRPSIDVATYPVVGKVVLADGKPLTTGVVVLVAGGEGERRVAGAVHADGTFSLMTDGVVAGAPAGDYKVRVEIDPDATPVTAPGARKGGLPFPVKYSRVETSGLTASVKAELTNELPPFVLK